MKTLEDFAGCVPDDLVGWSEKKDGETVKHEGFLTGLDVSREQAEAMILAARIKAGWIEAPAETEETAEETAGERGRMSARAGASDERADLHRDAGGAAARRADPLRARSRRGRRPGHKVAAAGSRRLCDRLGGSCGAGREAPNILSGFQGQGGGFADACRKRWTGFSRRTACRCWPWRIRPVSSTAGFAKVAAALEDGRVRALVEAVDGGSDGRRKLEQSGRRGGGSGPRRDRIVHFESIGFGFGPHKCDTCGARRGRIDGGLPGALRAARPLSG